MYFSINRFTGDGVTTQWEFNFAGGYIDQDHVKVLVIDPSGVETIPTYTWVGTNTISIVPAVASGSTLEVYRDTPKNLPLVDYTDGAIVSEKNLDTTAEQSVFVAAEVFDRFSDTADLVVGAATSAVEAAELAAVAAGTAASAASAAQVSASNAAESAAASQATLENIEADLDALVGGDFSDILRGANNLSDVANAHTARSNLGLGNVDNTADVDKPVSTAQAAAISSAVSGISKNSLGLGNVDNTSDVDKPVSTAQAAAIAVAAQDVIDTFAAASGSDIVGFQQAGSGAVVRTAQDKMREWVSVKDFGAVGDGVTDDTAAILSAAAYIESTGRNILVPPGTYLTDPFSLAVQSYSGTGSFYGVDRTRCVLKRRTDGVGAFITFGAISGTIFRSHVGLSGIKVDGGVRTNGPAVEAFSLSRSNFNDCHFTGGTAAFRMYGGVSVSFQNCLFDMADRGLHIQDYSGAHANKWPNLTKVIGGEIVDNAEYGVWFDGGVMLVLDGVDIEGNGSTRGGANGGVYVGPNVGTALTSTSGESPGVVIRNCWVERNKGIAQIYCESGINQIHSSFFFANGVDYVDYDIRLLGGRFTIKGCDFVFFSGKVAQISAGPGVDGGNYIEVQPEVTVAVDSTKTCVNTGSAFSVFGGGFPAVHGIAKPLIQVGTDQSGSANPTITFARAFKAGSVPRVFCQTTSNAQLTIYSVDAYSVSSTGFSLRKKQFDGTTVSAAPSLEVRWVAVGEAQ